jgi:serine protease inhibitor ecotin
VRHTGRVAHLIIPAAAVITLLTAGEPGTLAQSAAPADLRARLEGTWRLEEWHTNGQILRPPQADGRWSNHDGVVMFTLNRTDTAESMMGYGVYEMTADTWGYRYFHMQTTSGPIGGPFKISVTPPGSAMRSFKIIRQPDKVILEGANDDRREYDATFFTFTQKGQIVRRWRRIS